MNLVPHPLNGRMHLAFTPEAVANILMWAGRTYHKAPKAVTLPSPYWGCQEASKGFLKPLSEDMNGMVPEWRATFIKQMVGIK